MDNHSTHITIEVIDLARHNNIHILALPSHSSHLLQPLYVAVYKPVKIQWKKTVSDYFNTSGYKIIEKKEFAGLFDKIKRTN